MVIQSTDLILVVAIFFARIIDVSLGTLRMIFISKGFKSIAPILGFFEVLIWIIVISKIMGDVRTPILYVAYAAGFAAGTFVGMKIEERLSLGRVLIRVITQKSADSLIEELMKSHYSITVTDAYGKKGDVKIIFSVIDKKELKEFVKLIHKYNPKAFYSVEDVRHVNEERLLQKKKFFQLGFKKTK